MPLALDEEPALLVEGATLSVVRDVEAALLVEGAGPSSVIRDDDAKGPPVASVLSKARRAGEGALAFWRDEEEEAAEELLTGGVESPVVLVVVIANRELFGSEDRSGILTSQPSRLLQMG